MLYKYDQKSLNKEIEELNKTKFTKIVKVDQKKDTYKYYFIVQNQNMKFFLYGYLVF